ncbi:MAG: efflux RND transporter periplasmic adaptor subunit [bacterium]|nr:efflux RND transporter periplasmic adaptor subunit [bacterium]
MKTLRKSWLAVFLLPLLTVACGKGAGKKTVPGPKDTIYPVSVAQAVEQEVPDTIRIEGRFIPLNRLEVKSDFTGKVQALSVEEGQSLLAGDVLLKIEDEKLPWVLDRQRAELREAEAQAELDTNGGPEETQGDAFEESPVEEEEEGFGEFAEGEEETEEPFQEEEEEEFGEEGEETPFARLARLRRNARRARQAALARRQQMQRQQPNQPQESREETEDRAAFNQARLDRIRADLALTEKQMEGSTLTTGVDGFVAKINVAEGSLVNPGDVLLEVVTVDPIDLSLMTPKEEIGKIDKQMKVQVVVPDLGGKIFNGDISFIGAELDQDQRSVEVRVRVDNRDLKIKVGMEGIANMAVSKSVHRALMVPSNAVVQQEGKSYVYVQRGQLAERVEVVTGGAVENMVEIKRGIRQGDYVVTDGVSQLKNPDEFIKVRS